MQKLPNSFGGLSRLRPKYSKVRKYVNTGIGDLPPRWRGFLTSPTLVCISNYRLYYISVLWELPLIPAGSTRHLLYNGAPISLAILGARHVAECATACGQPEVGQEAQAPGPNPCVMIAGHVSVIEGYSYTFAFIQKVPRQDAVAVIPYSQVSA